MTAREQPPQHRRIEEPPPSRDDRRKQVTNPAHAPVPSSPPVERDDLERGREKLERILS